MRASGVIPGPTCPGHELAQCPLERGVVELFGALDDLQQRVV
ncbi:MAG: hypothetical protein WCD11_01810 [Solirubrobacteraceae bacterium]